VKKDVGYVKCEVNWKKIINTKYKKNVRMARLRIARFYKGQDERKKEKKNIVPGVQIVKLLMV
jgi:hypothetical protein